MNDKSRTDRGMGARTAYAARRKRISPCSFAKKGRFTASGGGDAGKHF